MQTNSQNEKSFLKYLRIFFFFCSASIFPLSLISSGNSYIFQFISVPLFSVNSGFLFHKMVSKHVLMQLNRISLNSAFLTTIIYYLSIYGVGVGWANMFIDHSGNIKINEYLFLFLPLINGFIFFLVFSLRYYKLSLNSQFDGMFDSQSSGLAIIELNVRKLYDETLLKKNDLKQQLLNKIEQQKQSVDAIDIEPQQQAPNKKILIQSSNIQSKDSSFAQPNNYYIDSSCKIMSPINKDEKNIELQNQTPKQTNERKQDLVQQIVIRSRQSSQIQIVSNTQIIDDSVKNQQQIENISENIQGDKEKELIKNQLQIEKKNTQQFAQNFILQIVDQNSKQERFIKILLGLYLIFASIILQIIFSINITKTFDFLLEQSIYFIYIICMSYPVLIGIIKLIPVTINSIIELRYEWQIQFLSLFFASLPYRGLYLQFNSYQLGLGIILIKFIYKLLIYYLQFRFANQLFDLKNKIITKVKKQEKDGNILQKKLSKSKIGFEIEPKKTKKEILEYAGTSPLSIENRLNQNELKNIQEKNEEEINGFKEIEQLLDQLKQKGQNFYQMIYKLEMIQFSDILHMICVIITISISAAIDSNNTDVQAIKAFNEHKKDIVAIFFIELVLELIYTVLVTNLIGKIQDFYEYSFQKFMLDIFNFSKKQFLFIVASIFCSYSILFIVLNNS